MRYSALYRLYFTIPVQKGGAGRWQYGSPPTEDAPGTPQRPATDQRICTLHCTIQYSALNCTVFSSLHNALCSALPVDHCRSLQSPSFSRGPLCSAQADTTTWTPRRYIIPESVATLILADDNDPTNRAAFIRLSLPICCKNVNSIFWFAVSHF